MKLSVSNQYQSNTSKPMAVSYCFNHHKFHTPSLLQCNGNVISRKHVETIGLPWHSTSQTCRNHESIFFRETSRRHIVWSRHKYKNVTQFDWRFEKNCNSTCLLYINSYYVQKSIVLGSRNHGQTYVTEK